MDNGERKKERKKEAKKNERGYLIRKNERCLIRGR